ncbi:MAG TPA: restriction endonuclease [Candidatus Saccharimonadales bacterium]
MSDVDNLSGLEFEDYVSGLLSAQGYVVRLTPINDFGVDVIALRDNIRTAVQTKRYSKPVGLRAVQEVCGGMVQHHCTRTMVVTSNYFTPKAKQLAKTNGCRLVDRDELARWVSSYS